MQEIVIKDEFIKLQQALQLCGACGSGVEAKYEILDGNVQVNGETELRRGKKLREGDEFSFDGKQYRIVTK
ncbi:MAG: RNA-binding S4 domain-containing protein [Lachnospiraceae bacterium]|nr:RNA-binding S4 domain-containing protein [Lachnospiraceae bacterium]